MMSYVKTIEDLSLNAWPSHQIQFYDGWILRFSYFYTHRTNSVEQIGPSNLPWEEKITYCENIYSRWGTPCIFKITPLMEPTFDKILKERGYITAHVTEVKTMSLENREIEPPRIPVQIGREITPQWLDALFRLKGTANTIHRRVVPTMYAAIPKETIVASITVNGQVGAIGLGILDRDHIGLYAIHVDPAYRQQGFGRAICQSILNEGIRLGALGSYLQVVPDNISAKNLYTSLGYQDCYTYWFRLKHV